MQGINRSQHEHLKSLLIKLEEGLSIEEVCPMDENDLQPHSELEVIRAKRLQMQALYIEYLKKLADIEMHIAHYKKVYNDVNINFVSARIRKLNKTERLKCHQES
ncbi:hypothetical protein [Pedobacter alluvionis]|uniref:Uncharacterized protein n=1 Tax=Pedobacter alluvionis TaxID=475253 RepID=A0A497XLN6_9SPHI|nr:hypothetical protein [Pedobacter alluvionis]RLJ69610.1 hypothetical protein BCL90_5208 [Pedobacter alluvionis]TFB28334.1 hypothetical protein E3V97_22870 [Pedobacter alluvionis]